MVPLRMDCSRSGRALLTEALETAQKLDTVVLDKTGTITAGKPALTDVHAAASLAGGFATSQAWLLAARAVQGAGGAIVAPAALALIATTSPEGPPRSRAMGVYAAMSAVGGAAGLLAGGLLVTYASWRWVLDRSEIRHARHGSSPRG
jgi:MFS family permease